MESKIIPHITIVTLANVRTIFRLPCIAPHPLHYLMFWKPLRFAHFFLWVRVVFHTLATTPTKPA
jgi:hypothetical protein